MIARVDCYVADVIHNVCYCCFSPRVIAVLDWACVVQSGWCLPNWFILALHLSVIEVIGIYRWRIDLMVSISVILVWCSPFALNVSVFVLTFDFWSVWSFSFGSVWHSSCFFFCSFRWSGFFFCVFVLLLFCFLFRLLLKFVGAKLFWDLDCRGCLSMHALSRCVSRETREWSVTLFVSLFRRVCYLLHLYRVLTLWTCCCLK